MIVFLLIPFLLWICFGIVFIRVFAFDLNASRVKWISLNKFLIGPGIFFCLFQEKESLFTFRFFCFLIYAFELPNVYKSGFNESTFQFLL